MQKRKEKQKGWKEIPEAGLIVEAGSAMKYNTGTWRASCPMWDREKCTHCLICWIFCPESSIIVKDGKMVGIDLEHCKGCSICARECPVKAIAMEPESKGKKKKE